jgi:Fe2+ or Zn2+ uptake regulation protein
MEIQESRTKYKNLHASHSLLTDLRFDLSSYPGECIGFLVCRACGAVQRVPHSDEIRSLEEEMAERYGYRGITHELELYGVCPQCEGQQGTGTKPTKLLTGMRLRRGA